MEWSPDGEWLTFWQQNRLWRVPSSGGDAQPLTKGSSSQAHRPSPDGRFIYFIGAEERASQIWSVALESGEEHSLANLSDRRGHLGIGLATDGEYIYFTWNDDIGDIWVMDVVTDESKVLS